MEYLDAIARAKDATGLKYVLFGGRGPDLLKPDADVRRRETDECIAFYEMAAQRFKLTVCTRSPAQRPAPNTQFTTISTRTARPRHRGTVGACGEGVFRNLGIWPRAGLPIAFETPQLPISTTGARGAETRDRIRPPQRGSQSRFRNIILNPNGGFR